MGKRATSAAKSHLSTAASATKEMSFFEKYDLITQSGYFDGDFYLKQNPDAAKSGVDPVLHYLEKGGVEGRDPHPDFDTAFYQEQCNERGIQAPVALVHFLLEGRGLGLSPNRHSAHDDEESQRWTIDSLIEAGLFDWTFYNAAYGQKFPDAVSACRHFLVEGYKEGKRPNLYFDPTWYLQKHADVAAAGAQPLVHYYSNGDAEGRTPSLIFDSRWYREHYGISDGENTLSHYLAHRRGGAVSPIPDFDIDYYLSNNKDVREAKIDAFEHFFSWGYKEGRNPSAKFNIRYYVNRYLAGSLDKNPFIHYLEHKHEIGVHGAPPDDEVAVHRSIRSNAKPAADFEEFKPIPVSAPKRAKVLAYYLPQFHAFPENDEWWGKGFTEWTNIARGVPRYRGHFQPRIPRDLGFYTLDSLDTLRKQVALAKGGGVHGFVFYYYWFNGKRLMEKPVDQFLDDKSIDMPFALMWANENWTRRWDGDEHEVLIKQDYDPDDDERLIGDFVRHFSDKRYIRVNGRPLLMIYRPGIIPDSRQAIARWRTVFREKFGENPIMVMAQAFNDMDPAVHGLDGAIEFPPHKLTVNMRTINQGVQYLDMDFTGQIYSYDDVVKRSVDEPMPSFPLIKTAVPSWDNDARRQGTGLILDGSSPAKYEAWLSHLIRKAEQSPFFGERFVCVNAWNEWCEAAYLEPDLHYGSAYLNATSRAVSGVIAKSDQYKVLLVGHDAFPSGAQHLLINIGRRLLSDFNIPIEFLLLSGGKMEKDYREIAPVTVLGTGSDLEAEIEAFKQRGFLNAIVNTTASAHILPYLRAHGIESICLVHELPRIIREKHLQTGAKAALELSRYAVFASNVVRDQVAEEIVVDVNDDRMLIIPQGMYKQLRQAPDEVAAIREELGIKNGEKLVVNMGYADLRKGFDLFMQLWRQLNANGQRVHFCWIGDMDPQLKDWTSVEVKDAKDAGTFHMPGYRSDVDAFLYAADAFALTSREDPFPTVVHEALTAGLPVFAFDKTGGMPEFLKQHGMGTVVPHCDVNAMGKALAADFAKQVVPSEVARRKTFVDTHLNFGDYVRRLVALTFPHLASVSVAVPNYNYARFMPERLGSVFQQSYPVTEVIVLDDCSTDDSLEVIPRIAKEWKRRIRLLANETNAGSVFAQWRKAAERAHGEFLWIAEADDQSDPSFVAALIEAMQNDPNIVLGFTDSKTINSDGSPLWENYKGYYAQLAPGTLSQSGVFDGKDFVKKFLSVRNLILNVSSVVWRREALLKALNACQAELRDFRMAGDWRLYIEALAQPKARVAYISDPLNVHRRHAESVTHALKADQHVAEIVRCHELVAKKLDLPARLRAEQSSYVETVRKQLSGSALAEAATSAKPAKARKTKAAGTSR
jgi:glycosyltransferase involved in cell wall biosynthesis